MSHLIDRYPYGGHRAILKAMTIGEREDIPPETGKQYAQTGIAHLLAVSGLHVGIMMVVLSFLLRPLPLSKGSRFGVTVLFMFLYAGICGFLPPVSRAVIMFTLLNGAFLVERPGNMENILFASLIIILAFDPRALSGASLQLSFAAVWAITTFYRPLYDLSDGWTRRASRLSQRVHRSKLARYVISLVITSFLATVGTAPIVAYHFGSLPVYGILANLAAVPLAGLIVPLGVFSIAATALGAFAAPVAHFLSFFTGLLLSLMNLIAAFTSSLPHSTIETAATGTSLFAGCCLALWLYVLSRSLAAPRACSSGSGRPLFKKLLLYIPLVFLLVTAWNPVIDSVRGKDRQAVAVFFDVGQGDAALITIGNSRHILVDTGPAFGDASVAESFITPSLKNAGISRLDGIFISHPHSDHIGGLDSIVRACDVRHIFCSPALSDSLSSVYGERVIGLGAGDSVAVGENGMLVLAPASANPMVEIGFKPARCDRSSGVSRRVRTATESEANNSSLVFRLDVAGKRILFTGDIESPIQQKTTSILSWGAALRADILKVPHHGAGGMSSAFIRAVHPSVAVISCGAGNRFGHPAQSTLATLEKEGSPSILVMRTDRDGSILVRLPDLAISSQ